MASFIVLLLLLVLTTTAHAQTVLTAADCGRTLPAGHYVLTADMVCEPLGPSVSGTALVLETGARVDLQDHHLRCPGYFGPCVTLQGWGTAFGNGTLDAAETEAVLVSGLGGHYLYDLTVPGVDGGVQVVSHWNLLSHVTLTSFISPALDLIGSGNWVASSTIDCPELGCVWIRGTANAFLWNLVTVEDTPSASGSVVQVSGNFNWLARNILTNTDGLGITVSGQQNVIQGNQLMASGLDAKDTNGDCRHNVWVGNTGMDADPACIQLTPLPSVAGR